MSQPQPDHELEQVRPDPDATPRPEEDVADAARDEPVAGGDDAGEPAQGEGAPDSY